MFDANTLNDGLMWYSVFLFSTVCHEAAHAWSAAKLGDDTARQGGQVSLNPVPHIRREPFGMVVVPLLSWFMGGWLIGWASAPYNPDWARRYPRRSALMALAGPAANLGLLLAAALLLRVGWEWHVFARPYSFGADRILEAVNDGLPALIARLLSIIFSLNLLLFVFNLIPAPPLDGSNVPLLVLPARMTDGYMTFLRTPGLAIVTLVIVSRFFGDLYPPLLRAVAGLFFPRLN